MPALAETLHLYRLSSTHPSELLSLAKNVHRADRELRRFVEAMTVSPIALGTAPTGLIYQVDGAITKYLAANPDAQGDPPLEDEADPSTDDDRSPSPAPKPRTKAPAPPPKGSGSGTGSRDQSPPPPPPPKALPPGRGDQIETIVDNCKTKRALQILADALFPGAWTAPAGVGNKGPTKAAMVESLAQHWKDHEEETGVEIGLDQYEEAMTGHGTRKWVNVTM
jgi:hypothetical protein